MSTVQAFRTLSSSKSKQTAGATSMRASTESSNKTKVINFSDLIASKPNAAVKQTHTPSKQTKAVKYSCAPKGSIIYKEDTAPKTPYGAIAEQTVDPFPSRKVVNEMSRTLTEKGMYREAMFLVVGVNFALRVSDLVQLRFSDLMHPDGTFRDEIPPRLEKKTRKSHKFNRHIAINESVRRAVCNYLAAGGSTPVQHGYQDYLFTSISNNKSLFNGGEMKPLTRQGAGDMIKKIVKATGVEGHYNTHSLRKTFGLMYMLEHGEDPEALYKLQAIYGHAKPSDTLKYIGITRAQIREAYNINLG